MPAKSKSAAKKVTKSSHKRKRKFWGVANGGALYFVAGLGIVGLFGGMLAGGAIPPKKQTSQLQKPRQILMHAVIPEMALNVNQF